MVPVWFTCVILTGYFPCKVTPSDMGEACSLCTNIEVLYHYVLMRVMAMLSCDYLVVKKLMILKMVD
jgi:hypothetical protein